MFLQAPLISAGKNFTMLHHSISKRFARPFVRHFIQCKLVLIDLRRHLVLEASLIQVVTSMEDLTQMHRLDMARPEIVGPMEQDRLEHQAEQDRPTDHRTVHRLALLQVTSARHLQATLARHIQATLALHLQVPSDPDHHRVPVQCRPIQCHQAQEALPRKSGFLRQAGPRARLGERRSGSGYGPFQGGPV